MRKLTKGAVLLLILSVLLMTLLQSVFAQAQGHSRPGNHMNREKRETTVTAADTSSLTFTTQPDVIPWVLADSDYEAPTLTVCVKPAEEIKADSILFQWKTGDEPLGDPIAVPVDDTGCAACTLTGEALQGKPVGVYPVYCEAVPVVHGTASGTPVQSWTTNLIVCRGIQEGCVLTFSDLHESWDNLGVALENTLETNNGYLPACIIATGDFANDRYAGDVQELQEAFTERILNRVRLQLAGLNTFWVAGNHDNLQAVSAANAEFTPPEGFALLELDYEKTADGGESFREELQTELEEICERNQNVWVILSAHTGLHVIGVDPDSAASGAKARSGGSKYNLPESSEIVKILNDYAERGLNLIYLFGHNHTQKETEFLKSPGQIIVSTDNAASGTYEMKTIQFYYGHAGYLTHTKNGHMSYTVLTTDGNEINIRRFRLSE